MSEQYQEYFVCANSGKGFVNYFPELLAKQRRVYILKGGPGTGKSTLMRRLGRTFMEEGHRVEAIACSGDPASLDGILLREEGIAVVDGTAPHVIEPSLPGAVGEYLSFSPVWDSRKLIPHREELQGLAEKGKESYRKLYDALAKAKEIRHREEEIYRQGLDFSALDEVAQTLILRLLEDVPKADSPAVTEDRFLSALTPSGVVHHLEALTEDCSVRCFIRGGAGTGKSTLLKKLAKAAAEKGQRTLRYHCSLDPDRLDMVCLPQWGICAFDATAPHEGFPSREGDLLVDLSEAALRAGVEEENHETLALLRRSYRNVLGEAMEALGNARAFHDAQEAIYRTAVDFTAVNQIEEGLKKKIHLDLS